MTRRAPFAACAVVLAAGLAAQDKELKAIFERYDANKDGFVVRAEFPGSDEQFVAIDKNKDKKIDPAEFEGSAVARRILDAQKANAAPPRERLDVATGYEKRFAALLRLDKNHDRRIAKDEWTGAPAEFQALDLDGNGVLDEADRNEAKRREDTKPGKAPALPPELKGRVPEPQEILKKLDDNKDLRLSKDEAARDARLAAAFAIGDTNKDGYLDLDELQRLYRLAMEQMPMTKGERGYEKPQAFDVPFDAWDKNHDDRLDTNEFVDRKDLFARIDANKDSVITRDEVARYKKSVEGDSFVERYDLDGDGRVTLAEFGGSLETFRRLDKNGDGVISAADR